MHCFIYGRGMKLFGGNRSFSFDKERKWVANLQRALDLGNVKMAFVLSSGFYFY